MRVEAFEATPLDLPVLARRLASHGGLAWLDGAGPKARGWSFLAASPVEVVRTRAHERDALAPLRAVESGRSERAADWLPSELAAGVSAAHLPSPARVPRYVGYVSYDAAFQLQPRLRGRHSRDPNETTLYFARYDAFLGVEHESGRAFLFGDERAALARLRQRLTAGRVPGQVQGQAPQEGATPDPPPIVSQAVVPSAEIHAAAVTAALAHIAAGDFYQVNLARRWTAKYIGDPLALFLAMRAASPVPLGAFVDAGDHAVLARTMETFLEWRRGERRLRTRPIKGTIPRAEGEDASAAGRLRADPKELAEHTMIVDLMRNDLARVAEVGSVEVEEAFAVEPYAKLSHLVSTVSARTRPDEDLLSVLRATFPPGSVTGAPKLAAMQAIEDLEPEPRGVYCGAIGHIDQEGGLALAVAIRTALFRGDAVHYFAGGGLVEASDPQREVAETVLKARVFLDAIAALQN